MQRERERESGSSKGNDEWDEKDEEDRVMNGGEADGRCGRAPSYNR